MRRLNLKLLAFLLVGLFALGGGLFLLNRFQVRRAAGALFVQAKEAERQNKPDQAMILLDRYLRYEPNNLDALTRYGILLADAAGGSPANIDIAMNVMDRILSQDPDNFEILRRSMKLNYQLQRFTDSLNRAQELLEAQPDDAEAQKYLGLCKDFENKYTEAAEAYRLSIKNAPQDPETYALLADLLKDQLGQPEEADKVMDEMVAANDQMALAYLARALYHLDLDRTDQAAADVARAVELAPEDPDTLLGAAEIARRRSDWDEIRRLVTPAIEKYPREPRFHLILARAEANSGNLDAAVSVLRQGLDTTDDSDIRWSLADLLIQQAGEQSIQPEGSEKAPTTKKAAINEAEGAKKESTKEDLIEELRDRGYNRALVGYLEARLKVVNKNWSVAIETLEKIIPELAPFTPELSRKANLMLAFCHERLGDAAASYDVYRELAKNDPTSTQFMVELARSLESQGRRDEALQQYRLVTDKTIDIRLSIARLLILQNLAMPIAARDWREVDSSLDELAKEAPDEPRVSILRAEVLVARDQADQARTLLEQARDANPDRFELWAALYTLAERQNERELLQPLLVAAKKQLGDSVDMRLLEARYLATEKTPESLAQLDALATGVNSLGSEEDRSKLLRGLADAYLRAGESEKALNVWMQFANQNVRNLAAQLIALDLAMIADALEVQNTTIERLKDIEGEQAGVFWKLGKVRQTLNQVRKNQASPGKPTKSEEERDKPKLDMAQTLLDEVGSKRSSDPRVAISRAGIYELKGNTDRAIVEYLEAIRLGERDLPIVRRVLQLLNEAGRFNEAQLVLSRIQDQSLVSSEMQRIASEISFRNDDLARALELAEKTVGDGSKNFSDYLWLGQMRFANGRRDEAEEPFLKAVELAPDQPSAIVGLVAYYVQNNKLAKAAEVVTNRAEKVLSSENNPVALAECYELIGLTERASELYLQSLGLTTEKPDAQTLADSKADSKVLRQFASFLIRMNRRSDAETYLDALTRKTSSPDDSSWAKNILSLMLASDSDPEKSQRGLEMVGATNLAGLDTLSVDDLRAKARVLAIQKTPELRQQAIRTLEVLVRREPSASDLLLLAQINELENNWEQADVNYRRAAQLSPGEPRLLIQYIRALLRQQKYQEIGPWLDQLDTAQRGAPINTQLRAMTYKAQGDDDKATGLLLDYGRRHPEQMVATARVLEQMGYLTPAQSLFQQYFDSNRSTNPRASLVMAEFLGRQGKIKEALDLCEPLWKPEPTAEVATVSVNTLQGQSDPAQFARVEGWLNAAIKQKPNDLDLLATVAIFQSISGRASEAEKLYRQILAKDSNNLIAMNNLAWLLAFQTEDMTEALQLIDRAIDQAGPAPALLDTRAVIHLTAKRSDLALRDLEEAIANAPEAAMFFHLARANLMADRIEAARLAWSDGERFGLKAEILDPLERESFLEIKAAVAPK